METSLGFASVPFPTLSRAPPSTLGPLCFRIQAYLRDTAAQFQITAIKQDVIIFLLVEGLGFNL